MKLEPSGITKTAASEIGSPLRLTTRPVMTPGCSTALESGAASCWPDEVLAKEENKPRVAAIRVASLIKSALSRFMVRLPSERDRLQTQLELHYHSPR